MRKSLRNAVMTSAIPTIRMTTPATTREPRTAITDTNRLNTTATAAMPSGRMTGRAKMHSRTINAILPALLFFFGG